MKSKHQKLILWLSLAAGLVGARTSVDHTLPAGSNRSDENTFVDPVDLIDRILERAWKQKGLSPAPMATEHEFIRRATLDILGRIPTVNEIREFLSLPTQTRRLKLCDRLVEEADFSAYWSKLWEEWLLDRTATDRRDNGATRLREWLGKKLSDSSIGFDKIMRDLISATPDQDPNASHFLTESTGETLSNLNLGAYTMEPATIRTARTFLGVRLECAQCHNHPFDDRFTQARFWEFNAFFRQVGYGRYIAPDGKEYNGFSDMAVLNSHGFIYYQDRAGRIHSAFPRFLEGQKYDPLSVKSRRVALSEFIENSDYFTKAYVNRIWGQLFGEGLNAPAEVDDIKEKEILVPELLDGLAQQFKKAGYKPKTVIQWVCKSKAYGLSSKLPSAGLEGANQNLFSVQKTRPLNPHQLINSIAIAVQIDPKKIPEEKLTEALLVEEFRDEAGDRQRVVKENITRVLALLNDPIIHQAIVSYSKRGFIENPDKVIEAHYLRVVGRPPNARELSVIRKLGVNPQTMEDLIHALINSAYFQLNY